MRAKPDDKHLKFASDNNAVILTTDKNFPKPNPKIQHPGIIKIYQYNNPKKDMGDIQIVKAIKNLLDTGVSIENNIFALNQYNY